MSPWREGDYPTEAALERIRQWDAGDPTGLLAFVRDECWWAPDWGWSETPDSVYRISTGGWSGNEDIIAAMQGNRVFWLMNWESSRRGGHYEFRVRAVLGGSEPDAP